MNVACPNCRVDIAVPEEVLRRGVARVTCKKCNFAFVIRLGDPGAAKPPPAAPPPKLEGVKSSGSLVSTAGEISKQPQRFIAADTRTSIVLDPELQREIAEARGPQPPAEQDTAPVALPQESSGLAELPTEVGEPPPPATDPLLAEPTPPTPAAIETQPEGFESFHPPEAPVAPPPGAEAPAPPAPSPPPTVPTGPAPQPMLPGMAPAMMTGLPPQPMPGLPPQPMPGLPPQPMPGLPPQPMPGLPPQPMAGLPPQPMAGLPPQPMAGLPPQPMSGIAPMMPGMVPAMPGLAPSPMMPPGMMPQGTLPPEPPAHGGNVYAHRPAYAVYTHPSGVPIEVVIGIDDLSPPRPGGATKAIGFLMLLVFLVGGPFLLFVLYRNDWSLDLANFGTMVQRAFGSQAPKRPASRELRGLELTPPEPIVAEAKLSTGERALLVQGVVKNNDTRTRRFIYVRVWLLDARGQKVLSAEAPAGNLFSKEQLAGLDRTSIQSHLNPGGSDGRNQRVEPGQTVAYMVVLSGLPPGFSLAEYTATAEVSQAELYVE
jgi:hypothetical protein